jgi:hypothetical protein
MLITLVVFIVDEAALVNNGSNGLSLQEQSSATLILLNRNRRQQQIGLKFYAFRSGRALARMRMRRTSAVLKILVDKRVWKI